MGYSWVLVLVPCLHELICMWTCLDEGCMDSQLLNAVCKSTGCGLGPCHGEL